MWNRERDRVKEKERVRVVCSARGRDGDKRVCVRLVCEIVKERAIDKVSWQERARKIECMCDRQRMRERVRERERSSCALRVRVRF